MGELVIGLDSSTQSLTAVVFDTRQGVVVEELSLSYRDDRRLNGFGFDHTEMIVPPREPGEADQPPRLFLASLDAIFSDLLSRGVDVANVKAINVSAQQHGHVYLGAGVDKAFSRLRSPGAGKKTGPNTGNGKSDPIVGLDRELSGIFSYGTAPIWKTSNTAAEAEAIRAGAGGRSAIIALSGSDSPLRFTGAVVRRVGLRFPELYAATKRIMLLSQFITAVLSGNPDVPADFGNAAGTSLMNYRDRVWDPLLLKAAASGLPGGAEGLAAKLSPIVSPMTIAGNICAYFSNRYGFDPSCAVVTGSGDNPQTKVLVESDLLSLGTSFVAMTADTGVEGNHGFSNAMYDGLGRPFRFSCRTNGALVWNRMREGYGIASTDHESAERALEKAVPGSALRLWQPDEESFPVSPSFELKRFDDLPADFEHDYAGLVDSGLGLLYLFDGSNKVFAPGNSGSNRRNLYLTGGPSANPRIVERVAAMWNTPVVVIGRAGAALGAAVAGAVAVADPSKREAELARWTAELREARIPVIPNPSMVEMYHGAGGYLERLKKAFGTLGV